MTSKVDCTKESIKKAFVEDPLFDIPDECVPNWNIFPLDSKPDDSLIDYPMNPDGYYLDAFGERIAFDGNRELRPAHTKLALNEYHLKEIAKCAQDAKYFIFNYCKVLTPKGYQQPELRKYQERYLKALLTNNRIVINFSRQSGKTVTTALLLVWRILFHNDVSWGIAANIEKGAIEVLDKIRKIYNSLPIWLQQGVVKWNVKSIHLENGSRVLTAATNGDSFRGFSFVGGDGHSGIFVDEVAFIPPTQWQAFEDSVMPTVSSDPNANIILTSTPNGYNHFYRYVKDASEGKSNYIYLTIRWDEVPGRDQTFKDKIIKDNGIVFWNQNYGMKFIGSSYTLIDSDVIAQMKAKEPVSVSKTMRIYEMPRKGMKYLCLVDLASGTGTGDYTVVQVIKIKSNGFEQVAVFHSNQIPLLSMTNIIYNIAKEYNNAFVFAEINYGEEVISRLYRDIEYENVLTISVRNGKQNLLGFRGKFQLGLQVNKKTKAQMLASFKTLVEKGKLKIVDYNTIQEMLSFVAKGDTFAAEEGKHDDLVMALALLGWLVQQPAFNDLIEYDFVEEYESKVAEEIAEEEILPPELFGDSYTDEDVWQSQ